MLLYHRTSAAAAILRDGFRDGEGQYLTDATHRGVWLSTFPLSTHEGAGGNQVLEVDFPDALATEHEFPDQDTEKTYREFLVPADVLNGQGRTRLLSQGEQTRSRTLGFVHQAGFVQQTGHDPRASASA